MASKGGVVRRVQKKEKSIDAHSEHPLGLIGHHGLTQDQIQQSGRAEGRAELVER